MKRPVLAILALAVVALAFSSGCDKVKDDIVGYSKSAVPLINKFGADFRAKMEDVGKADSKEVYVSRTRADLIPMIKAYRDKLAAIKPESNELKAIHDAYVAGVAGTEEGLKALLDSIEKEDAALAETAKRKVEAGEAAEATFKKDFEALAKAHDIKFE